MNTADEMLRFIPPYYSESKIYAEQNRIKGEEFDILKYIIEDFQSQISPETATWGLMLWEALCGIRPPLNSTVEERRSKVISAISALSPLSPYEFIQRIKSVTGETVNLFYTDWDITEPYNVIMNSFIRDTESENTNSYVIDVVITLPTKNFTLTSFKNEVYGILPAHLAIRCSAIVNLDILRQFTHAQLRRFTHKQLGSVIPLEEVSN
jgi:hypothetical protein